MKKDYCVKIEKEVNTNECYECFLNSAPYYSSYVCRLINIYKKD